jgi:hypothetical protein
VRLVAAVGVDGGGQVLDDDESGDPPVVEVKDGGVLALGHGDAALLDLDALRAEEHDALAVAEELARPLLPELEDVPEPDEVIDDRLLAADSPLMGVPSGIVALNTTSSARWSIRGCQSSDSKRLRTSEV